jgi:hypothetical protein
VKGSRRCIIAPTLGKSRQIDSEEVGAWLAPLNHTCLDFNSFTL